MMNEAEEGQLVVLASKHGAGDLLMFLGRLCADKARSCLDPVRRTEQERAASHCHEAAAILAHMGSVVLSRSLMRAAAQERATARARIRLTGVRPNYVLHTGGYGGLPYEIELTNAATGFALQRVLRELATDKPRFFGTEDSKKIT